MPDQVLALAGLFSPRGSRRFLVWVAAIGMTAGALTVPAGAAPRTIEKSFDVSIPVPVLGSTADTGVGCSGSQAGNVPSNSHVESFTAPAAGVLKVEVTGFVGDWDIVLKSAGKRLADGSGTSTPDAMSTGSIVEKLSYKVKKAGTYDIVVCNFAGGPTGTGKYVFTFGR